LREQHLKFSAKPALGRLKSVVLACILLGLAVALGLSASSALDFQGHAFAQESTEELSPGDQQIADYHAQELADEAQFQQSLDTPAAVAERENSADDYDGIPAADAKALATSSFADVFDKLDLDPARALADAEIERFYSDHTVLIEDPADPAHSVIETSSVPLRVRDGGDLDPVDLTLEPDGSSLVPENPIVDVSLPSAADDRFHVGPVGLDIADSDDSSARTFGSSDRFYHEIDTDTDLIAAPTSSGLEIFTQLRSPAAPEHLVMPLSIPQGASLEEEDDGEVNVVQNGASLVTISAPLAIDAQGQQVPVEMSIEEGSVRLDVSHAAGQFAYPILVDPEVTDNTSFFADTSPSAELNEWTSHSSDSTKLMAQTQCKSGFNCYGSTQGYGLYVYAKPDVFIPAGSKAHFHYQVPFGLPPGPIGSPTDTAYTTSSTNAYITQASFGRVRYRERSDVGHPFLLVGLTDGDQDGTTYVGQQSRLDDVTLDPPTGIGVSPCENYNGAGTCTASNSNGKSAVSAFFGLQSTDGKTLPAGQWREAYTGNATITYTDDVAPRIVDSGTSAVPTQSTTSTGGWVDSGSYNVTTLAEDRTATTPAKVGLGVKAFDLSVVQGGGTPSTPSQHVDNGCLPEQANTSAGVPIAARCRYQASSGPLGVPVSSLPEGRSNARVKASDPTGNTSATKDLPLKVDTSQPSVPSLSGTIGSAPANSTVSAYDLAVSATDGTRASEATQRSGVTKLEVRVDNKLLTPQSVSQDGTQVSGTSMPVACNDAAGSCQLSAQYQLDPYDYEDNSVSIEVTAFDALGHQRSLAAPKTVTLGGPGPAVSQVVCRAIDDSSPDADEGRGDSDCGSKSQWIDAGSLEMSGFAKDLLFDDREKPGSGSAQHTSSGSPRGIASIAMGVDGTVVRKPVTCTTQDGVQVCPRGTGETFVVDGSPMTNGSHEAVFRAKDSTGRVSTEKRVQIRVDHLSPTLTLSGQTKPLVGAPQSQPPSSNPTISIASGYDLRMQASDTESGVRSVELTVDDNDPATAPDPKRRFIRTPNCGTSDCHVFDQHFVFRSADFAPGEYKVTVVATDGVGRQFTPSTFVVKKLAEDALRSSPTDRSRLGLEQFFPYDSTETGLSAAHVNLATGNLVWHKTPITNPGRGLSSVFNLTYNSLEHTTPGVPSGLSLGLLGGFAGSYNQTGSGFSSSISGLTRLNEPLSGVLLPVLPQGADPKALSNLTSVSLTDPDGTLHSFDPDVEDIASSCGGTASAPVPASYDEPAGVNLRLRRFDCLAGSLTRPGTLADLVSAGAFTSIVDLQQAKKAWAITRPDGVTYFFDGLGYASSIEDRNGNTMTYDYDRVDPLLGNLSSLAPGLSLPNPCQPVQSNPVPTVPGVCEPRVTSVVDPGGQDAGIGAPAKARRTMKIDYYELSDYIDLSNPTGAAATTLQSLIGDLSQTNPLDLGSTQTLDAVRELVKNGDSGLSADQVSQRLFSLGKIQAITDHAGHRLEFNYDKSGYLKTLTEAAEDSTVKRDTDFAYDAPSGADLATDVPQLTSITDPRGGETSISYQTSNLTTTLGPGRRVATIENRRDHARSFVYDESEADQRDVSKRSRTVVTDARNKQTAYEIDERDREDREVDALGTATTVQWDDDNNVVRQTLAAGTGDQESLLVFAYNDNGAMTASGDSPNGLDGFVENLGLRLTQLEYRDGPGPSTLQSAYGVDSDESFVSDLTTLTRPAGNTSEYTVDPIGNVTDQYAPDSNDYGSPRRGQHFEYDSHGQLTKETNEVGDISRYPSANYDANGMPREVIDGRGKRWLYQYDDDGNLVRVVDPRRAQSMAATVPSDIGPDNSPYTTTLSYDALNHLIGEQTPKDSTASSPSFITRKYGYDENDNQVRFVDGQEQTKSVASQKATVRTFTPMDRLETEKAPEGETSAYCYDEEENLTRTISPRGTAKGRSCQASSRGYATRFEIDAIGRRVAEIRESPIGANQDLITSYAFDRRDNVIGIAAPRDNVDNQGATISPAQAINDVSSGSRRRFTYEYDRANQRTAQVEEPGMQNLALRTEYRYDADGNPTRVIDPRAFAPGVDDAQFTSTTEYDAADRPVADTDSLGEATRYGYRPDGQMATIIGPRADETPDPADFTTRLEYDAVGDLVSRSIPYKAGQYGWSDGELQAMKMTISRDDVGNPISVTDPVGNVADYRATAWQNPPAGEPDRLDKIDLADDQRVLAAQHTFANTFYDTGDLKTTERPGFFRYQGPGQPMALREDGSANVGTGDGQALPSSEGKGDLGDVPAQPLPSLMPRAGSTSFEYDGEMRLTSVRDAQSAQTTIAYDADGRPTLVSHPSGSQSGGRIDETFASYDANGNLLRYVDGEGAETFTEYDPFDRKALEAAPGSNLPGPNVTRYAYDQNGNTTCVESPRAGTTRDQSGETALLNCPNEPASVGPFVTRSSFDAADRLMKSTNPAGESWAFDYDAAGNRIKEQSPRGLANNYYTRTLYDAANRPTSITEAYGKSEARTTNFDYDAAGNRVLVDSPSAMTDSVLQSDGTLGPLPQSFRHIVRNEYDGRDLLWKQTTLGDVTTSSLSTTGQARIDQQTNQVNDNLRTRITEYDANGNLRRVINPAASSSYAPDPGVPAYGPSDNAPTIPGSGQHLASNSGLNLVRNTSREATVYEYDANDLRAANYQPWSPNDPGTSANKRYRQRYLRDDRGEISQVESPYEWTASSPTTYTTTYARFPNGWISGSTDPDFGPPDQNGLPDKPRPNADDEVDDRLVISYDYDRQGNQTLWSATPKSGTTADPTKTRQVARTYYPSGQLKKRVGTIAAGSSAETKRSHDYFYNRNGSLIRFQDKFPTASDAGAGTDATNICYDAVERVTLVDDRGDSDANTRNTLDPDSAFTYDVNGNVATRSTNGQWAANNPSGDDESRCVGSFDDRQVTKFGYDYLDQETSMSVWDRSSGQSSKELRRFAKTYYPSGDMATLTKPGEQDSNGLRPATGTKDTYYYDADGRRSARVRDPIVGSSDVQRYGYDANADPVLSERGKIVNDSRGRMITWQRPSGYKTAPNSIVKYELDGSGQISKEIDAQASAAEATTTTYHYDGQRLDWTDVKTGPSDPDPVRYRYGYDAFGNLELIDSPDEGTQKTTYEYDEFSRRIASHVEQPATSPDPDEDATYTYDGLDRRDSRIEKGKRYDSSYIGLTEELATERWKGVNDPPTQTEKSKVYDYDSTGQRLGVESRNDAAVPSGGTYRPYELDSQGSVLSLEPEDGRGDVDEDKATYQYDPYGQLENEDDLKDPNHDGDTADSDAGAVDNPFRFQGHYYDSGVATYDMRARSYLPSIARFTGADRYESAGTDLTLQSDPLTQNRYVFAGGNPLSGIEWDGHKSCTAVCGGGENQQGFKEHGSTPTPGPSPASQGATDFTGSQTAVAPAPVYRASALATVDAPRDVTVGPTVAFITNGGRDEEYLGDDLGAGLVRRMSIGDLEDLSAQIQTGAYQERVSHTTNPCDLVCVAGAFIGDPLHNPLDAAALTPVGRLGKSLSLVVHAADDAGGISKVARVKEAADDAVKAESRAYAHSPERPLKYDPRVRARAVEDPKGHNFPRSFDDVILKQEPRVQEDGSLLFEKAGWINSTNGVFEIAVNPETETIFHRTFRGGR
jgi:RHS repeat-associated protein